MIKTPIQDLGSFDGNHLWIKRDDLIPFSFGGNKARKAELFFEEIDRGSYDTVVTYGSSSSNHCRIISNACAGRNLACYIISPKEEEHEDTFNRKMMILFGAQIITVPVAEVHDTIEYTLDVLRRQGKKPFFIAGGGHGNIGTESYVRCYEEIREQEKEMNVRFDNIYFACGTGTTQAGLVCGQLLANEERTIIGISIARKNPRCREVVTDSVRSYLNGRIAEDVIERSVIVNDSYTSGYGKEDPEVIKTIKEVLMTFGIPLDATYTGKAFMGMKSLLKQQTGRNVLFIHTGGTPLFFDILERTEL